MKNKQQTVFFFDIIVVKIKLNLRKILTHPPSQDNEVSNKVEKKKYNHRYHPKQKSFCSAKNFAIFGNFRRFLSLSFLSLFSLFFEWPSLSFSLSAFFLKKKIKGNTGHLLERNDGGIGEEVAWDTEKKMLVSVPFSFVFEEFKKVFFFFFFFSVLGR